MLFRKTILSIILTICFIVNSVSSVYAEPQIQGKAAALIDPKSGEIIYGKNENEPLPPASLTKLITAILAVERTKLSDVVTVGKNPPLIPPSSIGLKEGERITVENLLYALLIKSANDTAVAIAEYISGSAPEFANLMNKRAKELGATNTHFVTPNGLHDPNHYSTAHDLALIAKHAMENPLIRNIVAVKNKQIPREDDTAVKWLPNHNKMLWRYEGANGVKTGYTKEAKQCLVSSAQRGDQEFIAVVLGSQGNNIWTDSENLLDYGFDNFVTVKQKDANLLIKKMPVKRGAVDLQLITEKDFYYTQRKGDAAPVTEKIEINKEISAPIKKGQVLGRINFSTPQKNLGFVNLVALEAVPEQTFFSPGAGISVISPELVVVILLVFFILWNIRKPRKRYRRKTRWLHHRNGIR